MPFGNPGADVVPSSRNKTRIESWERGFTELSKFRAREGHCCPGRQHIEAGFKLGQWVSIQRYWRDFVPVERKQRLDADRLCLGLDRLSLGARLAALLKFKRREGHCHVPIFHREGDQRLGWWVSTQRTNKELSAERKGRLNKIGFVWNEKMGGAAYLRTRR
jgi:hypothetical protein